MLRQFSHKTLQVIFGLNLVLGFQYNGNAQIDHWETVVFETDTWDYIVPSEPVTEACNTIDFEPVTWSTGSGGFGYGDGDDFTILPFGTTSVFQRITFNITDTSLIKIAALTIDYDDGFVAYLNGVEIKRELLEGTGQPDWDQLASGLHEAQAYSGEYPAQYIISKAFISENLVEGTNVLAVQTHNESPFSSDLSSRVFLHLGIADGTTDYTAAPPWFVPPVLLETTNLPIVIIQTEGGASIVDDPKINATMGIIHNADSINSTTDPFNEYYGQIGIEFRGSSSGTFPKKAYGLETRGPDSTNHNVSIFDWPIDNDWILYAPYSDKSLIRNVLTYKLGADLGNYAPRTQMVELVINDEYVGVYVFMERIKQNPGRVNVDKLEFDDLTDNELTGGYIVKIDKTTGGGIVAWTSPFAQAPPAWGPVRYQMHDPEIEEMHPDQLEYISDYITDFETALDGPDFDDPEMGYAPYIDVQSFIDFMIINELSKNVDGYRISTFLHKQRVSEGGKLVVGPLWDFNLGWGNANYCEGGLTSGWEIYFNDVCGSGGDLNNPFWWNRLVMDDAYTKKLNCRWQELRLTTLHNDSILNFIDEMEIYLAEASERNFERWPILGSYVWPNNFVGDTYADEMDYLRSWTEERLEWMDANMFGSCEDLGIENPQIPTTQFFPNPTRGDGELFFSRPIINGKIEIIDATGSVLRTLYFSNDSSVSISLEAFQTGFYVLKTYEDNQLISNEKIIRY